MFVKNELLLMVLPPLELPIDAFATMHRTFSPGVPRDSLAF